MVCILTTLSFYRSAGRLAVKVPSPRAGGVCTAGAVENYKGEFEVVMWIVL